MPDDNISVPASGQTDNPSVTPSVGGDAGKKSDEALSQPSGLPDSYKDKSVVEVVKMHQEAMKKLGEQSAEVARARQVEQQVEPLLGAIYSDPERFQQVKKWISEYSDQSTETLPDKKGDGKPQAASSAPQGAGDDTRRLLQNQVVEDFYRRHGIDAAKPEDRKELMGKISNQFADLVDPGGTKPMKQLLDGVPLDKLPKVLDNAYKIVSVDQAREQGRMEGLLSQAANNEASIGAIQSGTRSQGQPKGLSADEKMIAEKLGVPEEKYLKTREDIDKNRKPRR